MDSGGRFPYVAHRGSHDVSAFRIDPVSGALSAVAGAPFAAGADPGSIAIDPSGRFAYAANLRSNDVSSYRIDAASGALRRQ